VEERERERVREERNRGENGGIDTEGRQVLLGWIEQVLMENGLFRRKRNRCYRMMIGRSEK
jgi:hypothetical protein